MWKELTNSDIKNTIILIEASSKVVLAFWTNLCTNMRSKQQPRPSYRWQNKNENGKFLYCFKFKINFYKY